MRHSATAMYEALWCSHIETLPFEPVLGNNPDRHLYDMQNLTISAKLRLVSIEWVWEKSQHEVGNEQ